MAWWLTGELGRLLFIGVLFIELMLIIFIVPALTAGAITSERERKTYDLLQTTLISKSSFVVGKMQSALGYIMLLLLSAIPLQSTAFLFGGVSESELLLALVVLAISAITLGASGCSSPLLQIAPYQQRYAPIRCNGDYHRIAYGGVYLLSGCIWECHQQCRNQRQHESSDGSRLYLP